MDVESVQEQLALLGDDPEASHGVEDDLLYDFVRAVEGKDFPTPQEMFACAALIREHVVDSDRTRWYA
jgi:hypothetical protein